MDKRLFSLFENELLNEAKRIVPLVYNEKELIKFNTKEYKKFINKKYKLFSIDIELLLLGLCGMKSDGEDWENDKFNIEKSIDHHCKILDYDKKEHAYQFGREIHRGVGQFGPFVDIEY